MHRIPALLFATVTMSLGVAAAMPASAFDPDKPAVRPSDTIAFENINPAIEMGAAWGDRGQGAHGTFGKFPAEFRTPFHTHSGAYHGIVLAGLMTNPFQDEKDPPRMGSGSYWYVPAGAVHATACVSKEPCRFYFHAESAFDFVAVE